MDNGSNLNGTAFLLSRPPAKKRVVYFIKSDSEMESNEDSGKAKKADAINSVSVEFELGHDPAPALTHHLGMSKSVRSHISPELGPDLAPALTHILGTSKSATSCALAPVTSSLPGKKKLWPSQR